MAKFKIHAVLDTSVAGPGTVTIDRKTNVFSVRPKGRRKVYELPLSVVASIVVAKCVKADI